MSSKYCTLDDLVQFCSDNNFLRFDSKEFGKKLLVHTPATFETIEENSSLLMAKIKIMHTGENRNGSSVTEDAAEKCLPGIKYKPILANFCEYENESGEVERDFTSHDMVINQDGTTTYIERQVGCFTADAPYVEEESDGRKFIYAYGAIPREYTDAAEIIERKGGTKVSAELAVNQLSYDSENKVLVLEDIELMGVTLLGKNPETLTDVQEGMKGAKLTIEDFSVDPEKKVFSVDEKLIETLEKLNETLSRLDIDNTTRKEETFVEFETKKKPEDDTTPIVVPDDDDSVTQQPSDDTQGGGSTSENEQNTAGEGTGTGDGEPSGDDTTPGDTTEGGESGEPGDTGSDTFESTAKYSLEIGSCKKDFAVSLSEVIYSLTELVNETYCQEEDDWYYVDVFDDPDNYVIMESWFSGKAYKQSFKKKKGCYSLVGDRVPVKAVYVTEDEEKELENMRSKFSSISEKLEEVSEKLEKHETEPQKMEVLESPEYGFVSGVEEFESLKLKENHFDLTIEEVRAAADEIVLKYAKKYSFSENAIVGKKTIPAEKTKQTKKSRYGGAFNKED